jgi:ParB-like chromosome segregation protein Spo0J
MAKGLSPRMAQRIELWPVDRLRPYERNARTHGADQLAQLQASIKEFGFTAPILVDSDDGILAGHGRLEAARALGMTEVPVVVLDHLTAEQRRAYVLADNKLAENAGWDLAVLDAELSGLLEADFDLMSMGFSDDDLKRLQDGLDLGSFEELSQGTERVEPEDQGGLGLPLGDGEEEEPDDATAESGEVEERHVFSVNLLWDDREVVLSAVRLAKERHGLEGTPEALVQICREWMDDRSG